MPVYSGVEQLFRFDGINHRGAKTTVGVVARSYPEAVKKVGRWGVSSATLLDRRYLEGSERPSVSLYEIASDPFLGERWAVAIDGLHRATRFELQRRHLTLKLYESATSPHPQAMIRVLAHSNGSARVWIGHPEVIAPATGDNGPLLESLGWKYWQGRLTDGYVTHWDMGWNLAQALHHAVSSLVVCGAITEDSYLQVRGDAVVYPTIVGWWTDVLEVPSGKLYRLAREWPPPGRPQARPVTRKPLGLASDDDRATNDSSSASPKQ